MRARVHIILKPAVLDPQGKAVSQALAALGFEGVGSVRQGKVIDIELDQWYLTIMHALMDGSQAGGRENFRVFLETARRNSQAKGRMTGNQADTGESIPEVTLTDNELDAWYLAIMHALMNKGTTTGQDTFRAHLETAKLKWRREGHLQTLRQAANIEILVDLN